MRPFDFKDRRTPVKKPDLPLLSISLDLNPYAGAGPKVLEEERLPGKFLLIYMPSGHLKPSEQPFVCIEAVKEAVRIALQYFDPEVLIGLFNKRFFRYECGHVPFDLSEMLSELLDVYEQTKMGHVQAK